ncbi:MAG: NAD-dependent epimerase/dehydratase family protein [Deltaproteobacteria bacterium]|nr:NAD-dependent epimerase/dehydratase family protein [Deltaproteobacteria bacterium]
MKRVLVTGAAGFIGSNLCDFLLDQGCEVAGLDSFVTGQREFLSKALKNAKFQLHEVELADFEHVKAVTAVFKPDTVIHLAANADVRFGLQHPRKDLEQGTVVTFNVLEAARLAGATKFAFSSTGSVYGEPEIFPTPETCPFPVQTSLYAAAKLAAEGMIQAYAEGYGMKGYILRFVSILGERYTHGHVYDFANKILDNPKEIDVLGDGKQTKAYLYIGDCLSAIWHILNKCEDKINIYNLGPDEHINVDQSLDVICKVMDATPKRNYSGGKRGWIGDSPFIFLDCKKLKSTGWKSQKTIRESVELTIRWLLANDWVLKRRQT